MYLNPYPLLEQALLSDNPDEKGKLTQALFAQLGEAEGLTAEASKPVDCRFAGHPSRPRLVAPSEVTPRKMNTVEGYAAMLHAIAHIEFNAINLALDAAYRFRNMPFQFVRDWVRVAKEEVFHFGLMRGRLNSLGYDYGDFEAHGHLWDMAYKT
ncbi:MAG: DUF455 family protein, partial [Neisseria sp.]|nr:DUF455 family protein [Neisseria sp.]